LKKHTVKALTERKEVSFTGFIRDEEESLAQRTIGAPQTLKPGFAILSSKNIRVLKLKGSKTHLQQTRIKQLSRDITPEPIAGGDDPHAPAPSTPFGLAHGDFAPPASRSQTKKLEPPHTLFSGYTLAEKIWQ
jgi:hypothetical protein